MTNSTCKGCLDRKPGCHDHCERFKAWQQLHKAELAYSCDIQEPSGGHPECTGIQIPAVEVST